MKDLKLKASHPLNLGLKAELGITPQAAACNGKLQRSRQAGAFAKCHSSRSLSARCCVPKTVKYVADCVGYDTAAVASHAPRLLG